LIEFVESFRPKMLKKHADFSVLMPLIQPCKRTRFTPICQVK